MAAKLEYHPASNLFPLLEGNDFQEVVESVKVHGLQLPILLHQGKILDGRNRYRACLEAKVEPWTAKAELEGMTPEQFVWVYNGPRRHLTTSQRAMIGEKLRKAFEAEAAERMNAGKADPRGNSSEGRATERAGKAVGVSRDSIEAATKVKEQGSLGLIAAVERGEIAVSKAAKLAELPKATQTLAVKGGPAVIKEVLAEAKEAKSEAAAEAKADPTTADLMAEWNTAIEAWARSVPMLTKSLPEGAWMDQNRVEIITSQLKAAANTARAVKGHDLCPKCNGEGCKKCRKTGWLNKVDFESAAT